MGKNKNEMTYLEHLNDLRIHLIKASVATLLFAIVAFVFGNWIVENIIFAPKEPEFITNKLFCYCAEVFNRHNLCINSNSLPITNYNFAGQFNAHIYIALFAGIILASPYILWQMWIFAKPALHIKEKRESVKWIMSANILFITGALFAYFVIVPLTIHFFSGYRISHDVLNNIKLQSYVSTIAVLVAGTAIMFELPLILYMLIKAGVVTIKKVASYRKHTIVIIMLLAAIITPPDIFSLLIVSLPLLIMFEITIQFAKRKQRIQKKQADQK
ncbi:MAG: twin-arginine translocase subunit TatC [Bacteroidales bacterium]|jgi:sec-independent protein translocase protein TatC|nr:twin-arginine translocase subunit TatC [Bacteroidales bacterium]